MPTSPRAGRELRTVALAVGILALEFGAAITSFVAGYLGGLAVAASSTTAWTFAAGPFSAGLSSGLLGRATDGALTSTPRPAA